MSILDFFSRRRSAPVARERLQVLLAHERALVGGADLAAVLKQEILEVIARHIPIDHDHVAVKLDRGDQVSTLAIDIEVPAAALATPAPAKPRRRRASSSA
jgi:cell division topological specificity factor